MYDKPKVTIDLAEYLELKKPVQEDDKSHQNAMKILAAVLNEVDAAAYRHMSALTLPELLKKLETGYGVMLRFQRNPVTGINHKELFYQIKPKPLR